MRVRISKTEKVVGLLIAVLAVPVLVPNEAVAEIPVISGMVEAVRDAMLWCFTTVWGWLTPVYQAVADGLFAQSPDFWADHRANVWAVVGPVFATADLWFPITEMTVILTAYCVYLAIYALIKWIFTAAPFVG